MSLCLSVVIRLSLVVTTLSGKLRHPFPHPCNPFANDVTAICGSSFFVEICAQAS